MHIIQIYVVYGMLFIQIHYQNIQIKYGKVHSLLFDTNDITTRL